MDTLILPEAVREIYRRLGAVRIKRKYPEFSIAVPKGGEETLEVHHASERGEL
jgi:hypothetical protein